MPHNFDHIIDRRHTGSIKWYYSDDTIALWIADMDFQAARPILETLQGVCQHGILGYCQPTPLLYQAIIDWHQRHYHLSLTADNILFSPGVVPSLALMIKVFTKENEAVLINDPVYPPFAQKVTLNKRLLVTSALIIENGRYLLDLDDIEAKIIKHQVKLFILCNPHNPGGRVWRANELEDILTLCQRYDVSIISDEIHQDLTLTGHKFTPLLTIAKGYEHQVVSLTSATKTFNLAGIRGSMIFAKDKTLGQKISAYQNQIDEQDLNLFAYEAIRSAYENGESWLTQALTYIENNIDLTIDFLHQHLPKIKIMRPEASYLIWIDCSAYCQDDQQLYEKFIRAKVELNAGIHYGQQGHLKMRINVACPEIVLREGLKRIRLALSA